MSYVHVFDTMPASNRRTDRRSDRNAIADIARSIAACSKNRTNVASRGPRT